MTALDGRAPQSPAELPDEGALLVRAAFETFDITVSRQAGLTTVRLGGELDMEHAQDLRVLTQDACRGTTELCLDLTALTFLDSCGLAALVRIHNQADDSGVRVLVRGASERITRLFQITGLGDLFASA